MHTTTTTKKTTVVVLGLIPQQLPTDEALLISTFKKIMDEQKITILHTDDGYLSEVLQKASETGHVYYKPEPESHYKNDIINQLPSLAIMFGGDENRTWLEWDEYKKNLIPILGVPFYKGVGERQFTNTKHMILCNDLKLFKKTKEKYGDKFKDLITKFEEHPLGIGALPDIIEMCLAEREN